MLVEDHGILQMVEVELNFNCVNMNDILNKLIKKKVGDGDR